MAVAPADTSTAYYHTRDDVNDLKIRVHLRELSSSELLSASPRAAQAAKQSDADRADFSETLTLSWQQRVRRPSRPVKAGTSTASKKKKKKNRRIFTYTHKDDFDHELFASSATSSRLPDRVCSFPGRDGDGDDDAEDLLLSPGVGERTSYFIMADLRQDDCDAGECGNSTVLLCCLRYDTRGELAVTPDFSHSGIQPYRIKGGDGSTHFEYTIENVSSGQQPPSGRSPTHPPQRLPADDWSSDEEADEGALQLTVTGELTRLTQCSVSGDIYLSYAVHMPAGWSASKETECEGVSVLSSAPWSMWSLWSTSHSYVYSTPVSFTFFTHGSGNGWPVLLVGAFAVEEDDAERDVGWTAVDLAPSGDKSARGSSPLWSPAPQTPLCALQRTFLPGGRLLPPASYLAPYASRHQVTRVSRLGHVTCTTGVLEYNLHSMLRSSLRLPHPGEVVSQLPGQRLATKKVLAALRKSRRRLRQVTEGLGVPSGQAM